MKGKILKKPKKEMMKKLPVEEKSDMGKKIKK